MILYIDSEGKIKDVDTTEDTSLTAVELADEDNPFIGWSVALICCYCIATAEVPIYPEVEPQEGDEPTPEPETIGVKTVVTMMTPYVDSRLLDHIDQLGKATEAITPYTETKTAYIGDTEITFMTDRTGNLTVYFPHPYTVERLTDRIIISFDELEEVTDITISIL